MPIEINNCNPVLTKLNYTYWIRITKNSCAFAAPKRESIYIACNQDPILKAEIYNTGLITLKPDCMAETKTVKFSTHHKITSSRKI